MKLVIDTNILISAVLKGRKPQAIIEFTQQANVDWIISQEILDEY